MWRDKSSLLAVLMLGFLVCFELSYWSGLYRFYLSEARELSWIGRSGVVVAAIAAMFAQWVFLRAAFTAPRIWQVGYACAFAAVTALQYGYLAANGNVVTAHDLMVAWHSQQYWSGMIRTFGDPVAAVPSLVFAAALAFSRPHGRRPLRSLVVASATVASVHFGYVAVGAAWTKQSTVALRREASVPTTTLQSFGGAVTMLAALQLAHALHWPGMTLDFWLESADLIAWPSPRREVPVVKGDAPERHIVFVIDESIRGDHLSINGYGRATTPWLDQLQREKRFLNWGVVPSATSDSTDSGWCLLTGLHTVPDPQRLAFVLPTLFQYAHQRGFRTHLYDGGNRGRRIGLTRADEQWIDEVVGQEVVGDDPDTDFRIAERVAALLESSEGQFALIFKRGNHFPYASNFPPEAEFWSPSARYEVPSRNPQATINAYDNGIRYNVDRFFQILLGDQGRPRRTTVIYTSDHGQWLGDTPDGVPDVRGERWGDFAVPLLMFGDDLPPADTSYRASHHNIFSTLLDLMDFPKDLRVYEYAPSLLEARPGTPEFRHVLGGPLHGFRVGASQPFDNLTPVE